MDKEKRYLYETEIFKMFNQDFVYSITVYIYIYIYNTKGFVR